MNRATLLTILGIGTAGVVVAVVAAVVLLGGDDDVERKGRCQGVAYELGAERDSDDNRMEASLEIKADAAQQPWDVRITSNGREVLQRTIASDDEAEVDANAFLGTGEQQQKVTATFGRSGSQSCTAAVTLG